MALTISGLQIPIGNVNYYSTGFRNLIENHVIYLQTNPTTRIVQLLPYDEYKYQGDIYALFYKLGVSQDQWWVTLRVNGLHSPLDYAGNLGTILLPAKSTTDALLTAYLNSSTIN